MKKNRLNQAIGLALSLTSLALLSASSAMAQNSNDQEEETNELDRITVTGSRLQRVQLEGPSPVTIIDAAQIQREGFTTVFEVLNSLTQSTGQIQVEQDAGTFTQNANSINLRNLGPGLSLLLINGRRAADYPLPFNGQSNLVNLASIPAAAVERIEVLAGGASAIYGSDAVAGVINIVLRKSFEGHMLNARVGGTEDGGGASKRLQLVGGSSQGNLNLVYTFEYLDRQPIWGFQRDFQDSLADDPRLSGQVVNTRNVLLLDPFDGNDDGLTYIDPGPAACSAFSPELEYSFRPGGRGFYCGRSDDVSQFTLRNRRENLSGMLDVSYLFEGGQELYGNLNVFQSDSEFNTGTAFWTLLSSNFLIDTGGTDYFDVGGETVLPQRIFTHAETGGRDANNQTFDERNWNIVLGLKGVFGDGRFDYDVSYSHSDYTVERTRPLFLADAIDDYFLGPQLGTGIFGAPIYNLNRDRLFSPITPEIYRSLTAIDTTEADSSNDVLTAVVTGDLWDLPAGPVGFAAVAEWGTQDYQIDLDPRLRNDEFWGFTGTGGGGERDRYALGLEFGLPLHDTVNATLAGRWDKYDDITAVDDALTYNVGLEWRPIDSLLVRGGYATSFRAPDMHYVFADPSGFFQSVDDLYLCRRDEPGTPTSDCTFANSSFRGSRQGDPNLEEEEGESFTAGVVWNMTDNLSLSVDYYRVRLEGIVDDLNVNYIIDREADCRLGMDIDGSPVNINSAECQDILSRVVRAPADGSQFAETLVSIRTGPINRAVQEVSGIDAELKYALATDSYGDFGFQLAWSHVLTDKQAQFAADPIVDQRDNQLDLRSRMRGSVSWAKGDWRTTLFGTRFGSALIENLEGRSGSYTRFNLTVEHRFSDSLLGRLTVQNLFDKDPILDTFNFQAYPFYTTSIYDPTGREVFAEVEYRF
ncbi:TonB-dependent receptor plug domain-containing protein [Pseudomarimonas arenosa]|uniref:TonB-dependent receptor n=1 Tax=Pseudomarimonas arenosa TaxID=2774145 RepID=A0AAW3ZIK2_9GAMM|nr:TonB-dependent receptor [Pseudomarimonas arenosa]MBD8525608.1 TonB-dependent receptor [Pseudomarimonas arenosa]